MNERHIPPTSLDFRTCCIFVHVVF